MRCIAPLILLLCTSASAVQPAAITINLGPGKQPQVAINSGHDILVTFGRDNSIFFTRSTDGGKTFAEATRVAQLKSMPLGMRRGPRIAATKGAIVIAAISAEVGGGKDGDVVLFHSTDNGKSWQQSKPLNNVAASAREGLIGLASDGGARVFVVWLDLRSKQTEVYGVLSTDGGKTFGDGILVYRSPDGHVCECCHPSAAFDGNGNCYVMFRNWLAGNRDMYVAKMAKDAKAFEAATKLGKESWRLNACPMDGGGIVIDSDRVMAVYQRSAKIVLSVPHTIEEEVLGEGTQPAISNVLIAFINRNRQLMMTEAVDAIPGKVADNAAYPALATDITVTACAWESAGNCFVHSSDVRDALKEAGTTPSGTQPSP